MKIIVDNAACSGHGRCAALAPSVYVLDDRGYNAMNETEVAPGDEAAARVGASNCPERAITLVD
ncbi:MAG: ferredoxin [Actinomycetota bacterium]|nr:ferredoxin [Actinomycetota bacterium]